VEGCPAGQLREGPDVAADLVLALADDDLVAPGRGDPRVFEPCRAGAHDEHALRLRRAVERPLAPLPFAPDLRVVDALDAAAANDAAPAVVRGDAAADVVLLAVARLRGPGRVGEQLAREQDRIGVA